MDKIDLAGHWDRLWNSLVSGGGTTFTQGLGVVGIIVVLGVLGIAAMNKLRGNGKGFSGLLPALAIGSVCAAPTIVIPLVLKLVDLIMNLIIALLGNFT